MHWAIMTEKIGDKGAPQIIIDPLFANKQALRNLRGEDSPILLARDD